MSAEQASPLDFLIEELASDNPQQCVQVVSRLRVIALALGHEKTRSDLLPYLTGEIEQGKFTDEVQVSIAEVLGSFTEFVGGASEAHCLFPPLVALCAVEESTVRDQAVTSINQIGKQLSNAQLQTHLVPTVLKLARQTDWFTPRVSACGLFALAYQSCPGDAALGKELCDTFCKGLGIDDSPMVRRAAAARLSEFAAVLSEQLVEDDLLPLHRTLLADEQESVRVNALKGTAGICARISTSLKLGLLKDNFQKCVRDKSWRVRIACAEVIADIAKVCSGQSETQEVLQELYVALQNDHEPEVRVAAALRGAGVAEALGPAFGKDAVFPVVSKLAQDPNSASRVELANVLVKLAAPIEKAAALEVLLPVMSLLTDDENTNVRLAVINQFGPFIRVVGLQDDVQQEQLLPLITRLAGDKNWRVRHAILLLLPAIAQELGEVAFTKAFGSSFETHATDHYALIREDFIKCMATVGGILGKEWLENAIMRVLTARVKEKNYQLRSVLLLGVEFLHASISTNALETQLIPPAVEMAADQVPNLRIQALRALAAASPSISAELKRDVILPQLQDRMTDSDMDVKFFANEALKLLESWWELRVLGSHA